MNVPLGRPRTSRERERAEAEEILRESVVGEAAVRFACPHWEIVANAGGRRVYGVGSGLYPDLVALDGTDVGVSWILDVGTPTTVGDEGIWEHWRQLTTTGLPLILAVPRGTGRVADRVAAMLGMVRCLVYEYGLTPEGVEFSLPRSEESRVA